MTPLRPRRVAILTNLLAPYRIPVYEGLAQHFSVDVIYQGEPSGRSSWQEWARNSDTPLNLHRSRSIRIEYTRSVRGIDLDRRFFHIPYGLPINLVRLRPEAVLSVEMGIRTWIAQIFGWLFRRPVWVWWGGTLHTERDTGRFRRWNRALMSRFVRHWISYGDSSTDYLLSIGVSRTRILQIQNCVDERLFESTDVKQLDGLTILTVGQLVRRKGLDLLLESTARLYEEGLRFKLIIIGDGPERIRLEALAMDLAISHSVDFVGSVAPEKIAEYYHMSSGFVFPTLEDVWGLVVNEAMWSGIPVISSVFAGCSQEIVYSEAIFNPKNPKDFDRALRDLVNGYIPSGSPSKIYRADEISNLIADDIRNKLSTSDG